MPTLRCANGHQWISLDEAKRQSCPQCGADSGTGSDATIEAAAPSAPGGTPLVPSVTVEIPGARTGAAPRPEPTVAIPPPSGLAEIHGKTVAFPVGLTVSELHVRGNGGEPVGWGALPASPERTVRLGPIPQAADAGFVVEPEPGHVPGPDASGGRTVRGSDPIRPEMSFGKLRVPGYEILGELGRGGMGVVYKARQDGLNRVVALKMILGGGHAGQDQIARFKSEAAAVAHLQHPHIVQVYDIGEHDGCPFFSLEYIDGKGLDEHIDGRPQPPRLAAACLASLAEAMAAAHQAGIIHRDLKPANVLLTRDGTPKITDFGLAKRFEDEESGQTRTGAILGTPSYMSPEQASGRTKQVGPAADIYSLGAIFYEYLTGRPPFCGESALQTIKQVQTLEPVAPTRLVPSVPTDLETICLKALQKEPAKRYASAGALADDLRRFLKGEPIRARPTPAWEIAWKWAKRRRELAGLIAVTAVATVCLITLLLVKNVQVSHERDAANDARNDEARQRERAERNFEEAQNAVDQFFTRISGERLLNEPRMEKLRRDLLGRALVFYERFAQTEGDAPGIRFKTGQAQQHVGDIQEKLGERQQAEQAYREAIRLFLALADEDQANPSYRRELAVNYNNLGVLLQSLERRPEAEEAYLQALDIKQSLADDAPDRPNFQLDLAHACNNLGNLHLTAGNPGKAVPYYHRALDLLTTLAAAHGDRPSYYAEAVRTRAHLGTVLVNKGQASEGEKAMRQAVREQSELSAREPGNAEAAYELARMRFNLATLLQVTGRLQEAEKYFDETQQLLKKLVQEYPSMVEYRQLQSECYKNLGVLLRTAKRYREAETVWRQDAQLLSGLAEEFPHDLSYRRLLAGARNELAVALAGLGRNADAETEWRESGAELVRLVEKHPQDLDSWRVLAESRMNCCSLLAALGRSTDEIKARRELIATLEKLNTAFPKKPDHLSWLARAHRDLAVVLFEGNKLSEAVTCLREAIRDQRAAAEAAPQQPAFRDQLAGHYLGLLEVLVRQEDHQGAAQAVRDFTRDVSAGRPEAARAAALLAQCVPLADNDSKLSLEKRKELAGAHAALVVTLLRQALEHGYRDSAYLDKTPAFEPLRARDDFKKLLVEMRSPTTGKGP